MGVAYEGVTIGVGRSAGIAQIESTKVLKSARLLTRNRFIGSIHGSLLPNVVMLASPCKAFAIRVKVRWARGRG